MHPLLDFALENTGPGRLVEVCYLEDVCRIDPVVSAASHDMVAGDIELVDGNLRQRD